MCLSIAEILAISFRLKYNFIMPYPTTNIKIILSPSFFSKDIALLELFNKNKDSNITKEIFIQNIIDGLVYIALMDDDPIGYAILNSNGRICEYYVEDIPRNEEVKKLLLQS